MPQKIDLSNVALCAATTVNIDLTIRAINICLEHCNFAEVVLITDAELKLPFRTEKIPTLAGREGYSVFTCKEMGKYSTAPYVMIVQWDGYILDPTIWRKEFLDYDYIGAKWHTHTDGMNVGNGGFCIRSRKLMDVVASDALPSPGSYPEDGFICRVMRPMLERDYGIRFAPGDLAEQFSYERSVPTQPTFGFHGILNMWRHVDDSEMERIAGQFSDYLLTSHQYAELISYYVMLRKFGPVRALYRRIKETGNTTAIYKHFRTIQPNVPAADECMALCEASLG